MLLSRIPFHLLPFFPQPPTPTFFFFTLITGCIETPNSGKHLLRSDNRRCELKALFSQELANCFSNVFAQPDGGVWVMWKLCSFLEVDDCNSWLRYFPKLLTIFKVLNLKLFWVSICSTAENTREKKISKF